MNYDRFGLLFFKIATLFYGVLMAYRIAAGDEDYWSALVLPALMALILWKPRPEGWIFLRTVLFAQFFYYGLFLLRGSWWLGLKWAPAEPVLILGGITGAFFVAAIYINGNRQLFVKEYKQSSPRRERIAVALAISILFLPWAERVAWTVFDPRILDNKEMVMKNEV